MVKSIYVSSELAAVATAPIPTVDFNHVFSDLEKYRQENSGNLFIPTSHPALSRIFDSLSESSPTNNMESLLKKRWDNQFAALEKYKEEKNQGVHSLDGRLELDFNWVRIQREQYELYEQGMPNHLTKKRFGKLKDIGFGSNNSRDAEKSYGEKSVKLNNGESSQHNENKKAQNENKQVKLKETAIQIDGNNTNSKDDAFPDKSRRKTVKPNEDVSEEGNNNDERSTSPVYYNTATATSSLKSNGKLKGKCDICEKGDGFWGHNLQQCKMCGILVHELCYGMAETDCKDLNFICHACNAVGTEVEVNVPSKIGGCGNNMGKKRDLVRQWQRPQECVLCSHDKGFHAMHPLLDTHSLDGRQLCIERSCWVNGKATKEKRLAWVHTLCASVICSNPGTEGSVYGCDKDGSYDGYDGNYYGSQGRGDSGEEEEFNDGEDNGSRKEDDDEKPKKLPNHCDEEGGDEEERDGEESSSGGVMAVSSFAIASQKGWAKNIKDHRELKCFICGKKDKSWKIPIQCIAGDEGEIDRWSSRHKEGTTCYMAMHVGCARWGCVEPEGSHLETINGKRCRLCYYTPGFDLKDGDDAASYDKEKGKTVACCYCKAHARDIVLNNPNRNNKQPAINVRSSSEGMVKSDQQPRRNSGADRAKKQQPRVSSDADATTTEQQPCRDSAPVPNRELQANPQPKELTKQSSGNSSNSKQQRKGNSKKVTPKRKAGAQLVFGTACSKRAGVEFTEENAMQYPGRGRSSRALALTLDTHGQPPGQVNPNAAPVNNYNNGQAFRVLKR